MISAENYILEDKEDRGRIVKMDNKKKTNKDVYIRVKSGVFVKVHLQGNNGRGLYFVSYMLNKRIYAEWVAKIYTKEEAERLSKKGEKL